MVNSTADNLGFAEIECLLCTVWPSPFNEEVVTAGCAMRAEIFNLRDAVFLKIRMSRMKASAGVQVMLQGTGGFVMTHFASFGVNGP